MPLENLSALMTPSFWTYRVSQKNDTLIEGAVTSVALPQTAPHFQGITLLSSGIHKPSFSPIAVLSELLSMVHPVLEMSAIDLRAQGDSTYEMVYHTAAHGQVNALNFGADSFFQSVKGCGFSPQNK